MNHFALIVMCALTLLLSACGVSEPLPPAEEKILEPNQLEIAMPEIEFTGCTLPVLYMEDSEPSEALQDCVFWGCIRYEAKASE